MNPEQRQKSWSTYKRVQVRCKQAGLEEISTTPGFVDFQDVGDDRILQIDNPQGSDFYQGPIFAVSTYPGFLFCPQALSSSLQVHLSWQAVTMYCERPHATNIDLKDPKPTERINTCQETMWDLWKGERGFVSSSSQNDVPNSSKYYRSFRKLSWATTGYHYDWTARSYHEGCKSPMPTTLQLLAIYFARTSLACSTSTKDTISSHCSFTPSASIVNYYNAKSVMGGHRDDLEYALDKPVVSISLGLPAIFLLGGKSKDDDTLAIMVRPGDVMILGGDARLNYHGMAKVLLPNSSSSYNGQSMDTLVGPTANQQVTKDLLERLSIQSKFENGEDKEASTEPVPGKADLDALVAFLQLHRININVRQVYSDVASKNYDSSY
jgi:DNA alkylation damage repair protein AlkB